MKRYISSGSDVHVFGERPEADSRSPKTVSVLEFEGMSIEQIDEKLNDLPVGSKITGITDKGDLWNMDSNIEKHQAFIRNYYAPFASGYYDKFWKVSGYTEHYLSRIIYNVLRDEDKYHQLSPRLG